ncbi:MAG: ATP-binding protein [Candidatus Adiutrix sp.]|jgi:probable phosphoglycerate mutase|nr:ATP-binding protein [Candidatus Adiutrix sp.]
MLRPLVSSIVDPGRNHLEADFVSLLSSFLPEPAQAAELLAWSEALLESPGKKTALSDSAPGPELVNICGLPASGKSRQVQRLAVSRPDHFLLSFDSLMEQMPGYQADYRKNPAAAFKRWERPARVLGYRLLTLAVERKRSLIFEHGNSPPQHVAVYQIMRYVYGYKIIIQFINSPPELVGPRLPRRRRYLPPARVAERWAALEKLLPAYRALADEFTEIEGWKE